MRSAINYVRGFRLAAILAHYTIRRRRLWPRSSFLAPRSCFPINPESWQYVLIRWLTYVALSTSIGALAAHYYLRPARTLGGELTSERALARWGFLSGIALVILAGARLWAQWLTLGGTEAGPFAETMGPMLFETIWGWALIGQIVLAVAAAIAFFSVPRRAAWMSATALTVALCVTPGLSGHAVAETRPVLGVLFDTLHVIAGGIWLGTLTILVVLAFPVLGDASARKEVHALLVRFARLALSAAAVLALTGLYAAWVHVGSLAALWTSAYGRALLLKLCAVALAGVLGTVNWRVAVPRFTLGRVPLFAASGTAEVFMALLVYLLTAVFVARPLPLD